MVSRSRRPLLWLYFHGHRHGKWENGLFFLDSLNRVTRALTTCKFLLRTPWMELTTSSTGHNHRMALYQSLGFGTDRTQLPIDEWQLNVRANRNALQSHPIMKGREVFGGMWPVLSGMNPMMGKMGNNMGMQGGK